MKKAIITGSRGQDGRILTDYLNKKGYRVIGVDKKTAPSDLDITKRDHVFDLIKKQRPDEVYYLAAYHRSSEAKGKEEDYLKSIRLSYDVNLFGLANFLEGIRKYSKNTKIFYASSSLIFAGTKTTRQDETTPLSPTCIYGMTKQDGLQLCRLYRNEYDIFASVGILYNHESNYRPDDFLSKKIIKGALEIKAGHRNELVLGNLAAETDWGYAPDFVDAFYRILNLPEPDDFIVATGVKKTVSDFASVTFEHLDLDWKKYVVENKNIISRKKRSLVGNPQKIANLTGWRPTVDFSKMIKALIEGEKNGKKTR